MSITLKWSTVNKSSIGEFLAVSLMTELTDDGASVCPFQQDLRFNNTNGLLSLAKKGWLNNGRRLSPFTGSRYWSPQELRSFTELYFDKKLGKTKRLKNARLILDKAVVFDGGLGPAKKAETEVP